MFKFAKRILASTKPLTKTQKELIQGMEKNLGLHLQDRAVPLTRADIVLDIDGLKQHEIHAIENYGRNHKKFTSEPGGVRGLTLSMPGSRFYRG